MLISSRDNAKVKHAAKLMRSAKYRRETGQFILEGVRLCADSLMSGFPLLEVLYIPQLREKSPYVLEQLLDKAESACEITPQVAQKIADTESPQGLFCLCKLLDNPSKIDTMDFMGKFLALEGVRDPANVGGMIRTACALGVDAVLLSDCCDVYNPKALRASMGAVLKQPLLQVDDLPVVLEHYNRQGVLTCAALLSDEAQQVQQVDFSGPSLVVIGNEGQGLKEETSNACAKQILIPMDNMESLNAAAAAAILLWEMTAEKRSRRHHTG